MDNKWYQMWVSHSSRDIVSIMTHCDPLLQKLGALPRAPNGIPIMDEDGTIELRAFNKMSFEMAKKYLEDQGFSIVREQEND